MDDIFYFSFVNSSSMSQDVKSHSPPSNTFYKNSQNQNDLCFCFLKENDDGNWV